MADKYVIGKRLGLAAGVLALVGSLVVVVLYWSYPETTVIVLRHAEKGTHENDDLVPLSEPEGFARARTLAEVLERSGVSVIYVTQKLRTQQTAEPLATSQNITPIQYTYGNEDDINNLINNEVLASRNRGQVIVIVGHNDTVPIIVDRLGGGTVTVGNEFDNLFVLRVNSLTRTAQLIKATYGAPR